MNLSLYFIAPISFFKCKSSWLQRVNGIILESKITIFWPRVSHMVHFLPLNRPLPYRVALFWHQARGPKLMKVRLFKPFILCLHFFVNPNGHMKDWPLLIWSYFLQFKELALKAVNPHLFTIATLTGHACLTVGLGYSIGEYNA